MNFQEIKEQENKYILHTYGRVEAALVKGKNARAWDSEGKEYIARQAKRIFVAGSGMMKSEDKKELGERLVKLAQSELETLKK